jgi:hypothetical protein
MHPLRPLATAHPAKSINPENHCTSIQLVGSKFYQSEVSGTGLGGIEARQIWLIAEDGLDVCFVLGVQREKERDPKSWPTCVRSAFTPKVDRNPK